MRRALLALSLIPSVSFHVALANAENPEREKCTCDTQKESPPNNGAWVKNATACWSTEIRDRQWCDITVQSLEGSQAHAAIIVQLLDRKDDAAALDAKLQEQFQEFTETAADGGVPLDVELARDTVPSLLKRNEGVVVQCVNALQDRVFGKGGAVLEGQGGFKCSVGESSGWLRIEFQVGDVWLAYMIAPPPS
ncbi:hypothetical protein NKH10_28645 [Mesorhizobium sp. M1340]|uniref:hypothetical protein n=1 Tax=unclassified Mesorhizobium TaxID=325217 RepID=UPI003336DADD